MFCSERFFCGTLYDNSVVWNHNYFRDLTWTDCSPSDTTNGYTGRIMMTYMKNTNAGQMAKRIVFISLSVLVLVATILTTLFFTEKKHKENILNVYNECCQEAQEALYNYLNTNNESCYEQLCDNVFAMTNIALILKKIIA